MRLFWDVANEPAKGDWIVIRGGQIRYVVQAANDVVVALRSAIRQPESNGSSEERISRNAWRDLVYNAASTVGGE